MLIKEKPAGWWITLRVSGIGYCQTQKWRIAIHRAAVSAQWQNSPHPSSKIAIDLRKHFWLSACSVGRCSYAHGQGAWPFWGFGHALRAKPGSL